MLTGGAGHVSTTKGLTSISLRFVTCRRGDAKHKAPKKRAGCRKTVTWPDEVRRETALAWQRNDDAPAWCTRRRIDVFLPLPL